MEAEIIQHTHPEWQRRMDDRGDTMVEAIKRIEHALEGMATKGEVAALRMVVDNLVTKIEFAPVKAIAFGLVTIILIAFMGGVAALVIVGSTTPATGIPGVTHGPCGWPT